jgi:apolipoprotein D and lipocalin family protein
MKQLQILLLICLVFGTTNCQIKNKMINTKTVEKVELEKYLGTWYEIARFQHSFEKDLVGCSATYSIRTDGKIKVLNKGFKNTLNGKLSIAEGKAKPVLNIPGKLKVSFFWIFYADYNIMELDSENYQWALIGSKTDKYLWILCRTPQMDEKIYQMLIDKAKARGYDISKLIKVAQ